jgi:putative transposase
LNYKGLEKKKKDKMIVPNRDAYLVEGEVYHVFNKSIAEFKIINDESHFFRVINVIRYYQSVKPTLSFSNFIKMKQENLKSDYYLNEKRLIEIIAYAIMPTHLHLILRQLEDNGILIFMRNILNSYSRYFNIRHNRKGPLWEGRFKKVRIKSDEQLLHLTRYIHLNPVTAYLVNNPKEWKMSSYREYLDLVEEKDRICKYNDILEIDPENYRKFVEDRIAYQRDLAKIKDLIIE